MGGRRRHARLLTGTAVSGPCTWKPRRRTDAGSTTLHRWKDSVSALTILLTAFAGILFLATVISIHLSCVTARNKAIPRWIFALGGACLLVATAAVLSFF